jgi:hypothetical protein
MDVLIFLGGVFSGSLLATIVLCSLFLSRTADAQDEVLQ